LKIDSTIPKRSPEEQKEYDRLVLEKNIQKAAIALSFVSVFYFFIKLLFL
jgi:hypothetical protein